MILRRSWRQRRRAPSFTAVSSVAMASRYVGGVGLVDGLAVRIGGDQPVADIGDIELAVGEILPGMRVGDRLRAAPPSSSTMVRGLTPVRGDHGLALEARGFLQPLHPALEAEAVDEEQLRRGQRLGVGRGRAEHMGVAVGPDQRDDLDTVAADLPHHVAQDRERGDGLDLVGRVRAARNAEQDEQRQSEQCNQAIFHDTDSFHTIRLPDACAATGPRSGRRAGRAASTADRTRRR